MLREFEEANGHDVPEHPRIPTFSVSSLRMKLLHEEFSEYREAENKRSIIDIADALADIVYIAIGTAVLYGIPFDKVFEEVHRSNMSKMGADGRPVRRADGKIMKGENFTPPDIEGIIF